MSSARYLIMKIFLEIKRDNQISLSLKDKREVVDRAEWTERNSLSRLLLSKIDKILRKNKIGLDPVRNLSRKSSCKILHSAKISNGVDKISGFEIISDVPKKWTSYRIAEITFKSLMISRNT